MLMYKWQLDEIFRSNNFSIVTDNSLSSPFFTYDSLDKMLGSPFPAKLSRDIDFGTPSDLSVILRTLLIFLSSLLSLAALS